MRPVTIDSVRRALPRDHALVEIVQFQPLVKNYRVRDDQEPSRYVAYVLRKGEGSPRRVDIGPSEPIDAQLRELRTALEDPERSPKAAAELLYKQVFAPIEAQLGGEKNVIVSPDGALNGLPFATLVKDGSPLVADYTFSYVTSGRELVRGAGKATSKTVQVVANPSFEMNGKKPASASSPFARIRFPALPGTQQEAETIRSIATRANVLTSERATEGAVKSLASPGILHLATHGFFLADRGAQAAASEGTRALGGARFGATFDDEQSCAQAPVLLGRVRALRGERATWF